MPTRQVTFNLTSLVARPTMVASFVYDIETPVNDDVAYFRSFFTTKQWRVDSVTQ